MAPGLLLRPATQRCGRVAAPLTRTRRPVVRGYGRFSWCAALRRKKEEGALVEGEGVWTHNDATAGLFTLFISPVCHAVSQFLLQQQLILVLPLLRISTTGHSIRRSLRVCGWRWSIWAWRWGQCAQHRSQYIHSLRHTLCLRTYIALTVLALRHRCSLSPCSSFQLSTCFPKAS